MEPKPCVQDSRDYVLQGLNEGEEEAGHEETELELPPLLESVQPLTKAKPEIFLLLVQRP